ncbi:unnamed protein product, partial [marine sediment metagenome]
ITLCDEVISELKKNISLITDKTRQLLLNTGLLEFEKRLFFEMHFDTISNNYELASERFPDIVRYLSPNSFSNIKDNQQWVIEYSNEYKKSKIKNIISSRLNEILNQFNKDQSTFYNWYHSFESIHSILHSRKLDKTIWIDAVGIEWVSFIEKYIESLNANYRVVENKIGVANLPTSTEQNRFPDSKYIQDFDLVIHNNTYKYPNSIIQEFSVLREIIDSNIVLDTNQTIAIVSDHGLTALSKLVDSKKYGKNDSHERKIH